MHDSLDALKDIMEKQGLVHEMLGDSQAGQLAGRRIPVLGCTADQLLRRPAHADHDETTEVPHTGVLRHLLHAVCMGLPQLPGRLGLVQWLEGCDLGALQAAAVEATALVQFALKEHILPILMWLSSELHDLQCAVAQHAVRPGQAVVDALGEAKEALHSAVCAIHTTTESTEQCVEAVSCFLRVAQWAHACATCTKSEAEEGKGEAKNPPGSPPLSPEHLQMLFHLAGTAAPLKPAESAPEAAAGNPFGIVFGQDGAAVAAVGSEKDDQREEVAAQETSVHAKRMDPLLPCSVAAQLSIASGASVTSLLDTLRGRVAVLCDAIADSMCAQHGQEVLQLPADKRGCLALAVAPPVPEDDDDEDEDSDEEHSDAGTEKGAPSECSKQSQDVISSGAKPPLDEVYVAYPLQYTPAEPDRPPSQVLVVWRLIASKATEGGAYSPGQAAGVELPQGSKVLAMQALAVPGKGVRLFVLLQHDERQDEDEGAEGGPSRAVYAAVLQCNDLSYWPLAPCTSPLHASSVNDVVVLDDEENGGADSTNLGKAGVHEWGDVVEHCSEPLEDWPVGADPPLVELSASRGLAVIHTYDASAEAPPPSGRVWVLDIACDDEDEDEDDDDEV